MAASSSAFTGGGALSNVRGVTSAGLSCFFSGFSVGAACWVPWAEMRAPEKRTPPTKIIVAICTDFFITLSSSDLGRLTAAPRIFWDSSRPIPSGRLVGPWLGLPAPRALPDTQILTAPIDLHRPKLLPDKRETMPAPWGPGLRRVPQR